MPAEIFPAGYPATEMAGVIERYDRAPRDLIAGGKAEPGSAASHERSPDRAPAARKSFDAREDGWRKVVPHPAA
jgi:threonine dehydrogenase-like Zn-dependent dehydrogenase